MRCGWDSCGGASSRNKPGTNLVERGQALVRQHAARGVQHAFRQGGRMTNRQQGTARAAASQKKLREANVIWRAATA
jgi:hypothetical protein